MVVDRSFCVFSFLLFFVPSRFVDATLPIRVPRQSGESRARNYRIWNCVNANGQRTRSNRVHHFSTESVNRRANNINLIAAHSFFSLPSDRLPACRFRSMDAANSAHSTLHCFRQQPCNESSSLLPQWDFFGSNGLPQCALVKLIMMKFLRECSQRRQKPRREMKNE